MAAKKRRKKASKPKVRKTTKRAKTTRTRKASKKRGRKKASTKHGQIPLNILEKRLVRLNAVIKRRHGDSY